MLRNHTFGKLLIGSLMLTTLVGVSTCALARGSARYRVGRAPGDDAQMRELLAKLAAASGEPVPEERTDADLMYEAMIRWNGPTSSATDRVIEESKKDAARLKRATVEKVRHMFWKDPFADNPHRLIPVRQEDRDLLDSYDRRTPRKQWREPSQRESRESEVSRLRTELAEVRAENARLRDRSDMTSDRNSCVADESASSTETRPRRHASRPPVHRHHTERTPMVLASTAPQVFLPPPAPPVTPPSPPPAHGIIIEQLPSPPPPAAESGRRHGRTR